ncbi:MAG: topoisomerase C-terminal repeat-containing protein, partial [Pirellulaceae bacterium]
INLEVALKLLSLPREVGKHPQDNEPIVAHNGRFGPYIKWNSETRSLPADVSPLEVELEQSIELLNQPKRGGRQSAPKEPLRTLEKSPVTEEVLKVMDGRYGPYVTDGETNASLPKGTSPEEVTQVQALQLLADRAAKAPKKKKKAAAKKAPAKKTTKKSAKKKTATKKAATKKSGTKKATTKKGAKKSATKKSTGDQSTSAENSGTNDDLPW